RGGINCRTSRHKELRKLLPLSRPNAPADMPFGRRNGGESGKSTNRVVSGTNQKNLCRAAIMEPTHAE
ncbi:MAG: hypothetical protein ABGZ53_17220, partial [Fuerstiella sp.]